MKFRTRKLAVALVLTGLSTFGTAAMADAGVRLDHSVISATPMSVGSQVTYRMVVTNSGDVDLRNLLLAPVGTAYLNPSVDNSLAIGELAAGTQVTLEWTIQSVEPVDLVPQSQIFFHGEALDQAGNPVALVVSSSKEGE